MKPTPKAAKKSFLVTVSRTVTYLNDVRVEARDEQEAVQLLDARIKAYDLGWFDSASWGEAYFYNVEKLEPDPQEFEVWDAEEELTA